MELTFTQFRIVYESLEESGLPELLLASRSHGAQGGDIDWPPIPLAEARRAMLDLLAQKYVVLYDDSGKRVSPDEVVRIIDDDKSWRYPIPEGDYYKVGVTEEGERAYELHLPRFGPHGTAGDDK